MLICSGSPSFIQLETRVAEVQEIAGCFKNRSPILRVLEAWNDFMSSILSSLRMQWMCVKYGTGSWTIEDARKKALSTGSFCGKLVRSLETGTSRCHFKLKHFFYPPSSVKYIMCMLCWNALSCYKQVNSKYIYVCMCVQAYIHDDSKYFLPHSCWKIGHVYSITVLI